MSIPRKLAQQLLEAISEYVPESSRDWAQAMLHELNFVCGDWAALFWALGSAAAICSHAARNWRSWLNGRTKTKEERMNSNGKKAIGIGMGALSALMLVGCAFAVLRITDLLVPSLGIRHMEWTHWLGVLILPETIFIVAAVLLWRRKGPVVAGILTVGLAMALHVAVHFAMR